MKEKKKKQEKKPVFLRCFLRKTDTGIALIGVYETEIEVEKETKEGKKEKVKEIQEIEKTEAEINIDELKDKIKEKLINYGMYVKIQRVNAGVKDENQKLENWKTAIETLRSGEWERKPIPQKTLEKAKLELINTIQDPELKKKLKKELGLA